MNSRGKHVQTYKQMGMETLSVDVSSDELKPQETNPFILSTE
jgi:hypothetical protein